MDTKEITIAVDAMGGDNAPSAIVEGAVQAAEQLDVNIVLVGKTEEVEPLLQRFGPDPRRISVVHAPDFVSMEDPPSVVMRKKRDSSIMVAFGLAKQGKVHGVVSAGNSGATMAGALFTLGRIAGVDRPAIGGMLPNVNGHTVVVDMGANVNCKPHQLVQFAFMGHAYAQQVLNVAEPKVGLMSIGEEDSKGNDLVKIVHKQLRASSLNFIGNVEGRDVFNGSVDVIICDGFVGNVLLKVSEGLGSALFSIMEREISKDPEARAAFPKVLPAFRNARRKVDYEEVGGAPLLGINGVGIICHGSSGPKAILNAVGVARNMVLNKVQYLIGEEIKEFAITDPEAADAVRP